MPLGGGTKLDVSLLFSDSKGNVWIGTRSDGAYRLSDGQLTPLGPKQGLLGNQVRGIAEDSRGSLWIGTRNGGVSRLRDGKIETFGPEQGLPSPAVQAVYVDRADSVWVCTRLGLARIKDGNVATVVAANGLPANYFYQIAEDDEGYLLAHLCPWHRARLPEGARRSSGRDGAERHSPPVRHGERHGQHDDDGGPSADGLEVQGRSYVVRDRSRRGGDRSPSAP